MWPYSFFLHVWRLVHVPIDAEVCAAVVRQHPAAYSQHQRGHVQAEQVARHDEVDVLASPVLVEQHQEAHALQVTTALEEKE